MGKWLSHRNFNPGIAGSNPAVLAMLASFNGLGSNATNVQIEVRFLSRVPSCMRARLLAARMGHCLCLDGSSILLALAIAEWIWSGDRARLKTWKDGSTPFSATKDRLEKEVNGE